jgi:thioredoxin-dependent peroxiredoxin
VRLIQHLRTFGATVAAIAVGIVNVATHRRDEPIVLKPGDVAPDFSLTGSDGRTHGLRELAGRAVVIAWFPKAFTGGCTAECRSLGSSGNALKRFDVRYFAASVDSPGANARFAASLGIDFPILSDPTKEVARAYGVLGPSGFASRWTFIIGADGRILDIDKRVSVGSHGADLVEKLTGFRVPRFLSS